MSGTRTLIARAELVEWLGQMQPDLFTKACVNAVRIENFNSSYLRLSGFLGTNGSVQYHPYTEEAGQPVVVQRNQVSGMSRAAFTIPTGAQAKLLTLGDPSLRNDDGSKQVRFHAALIWSDDNGNEYINADVSTDGKVIGAGTAVLVCHAWTGVVMKKGRGGRKGIVEFKGFKF